MADRTSEAGRPASTEHVDGETGTETGTDAGQTAAHDGDTRTDRQSDVKAERKAARAENAEADEERRRERMAKTSAAVDNVRSRVAQVVWIICALAALVLAIGVLCIALKANTGNSLVKFVIETAGKLDFGVFSRRSGVFHFKGHGHSAMTKNALVNWGLAAVVWLVGGRILDRIIRP